MQEVSLVPLRLREQMAVRIHGSSIVLWLRISITTLYGRFVITEWLERRSDRYAASESASQSSGRVRLMTARRSSSWKGLRIAAAKPCAA